MKTILLVDDEPDVAELLRIFMDGLGYHTAVFSSFTEAASALRHNDYWAVFCDYMMPSGTGDMLYSEVCAVNPGLAGRFVLMTGAVLEERLDDFLRRAGVKVLSKPFRLEQLKALLDLLEEA